MASSSIPSPGEIKSFDFVTPKLLELMKSNPAEFKNLEITNPLSPNDFVAISRTAATKNIAKLCIHVYDYDEDSIACVNKALTNFHRLVDLTLHYKDYQCQFAIVIPKSIVHLHIDGVLVDFSKQPALSYLKITGGACCTTRLNPKGLKVLCAPSTFLSNDPIPGWPRASAMFLNDPVDLEVYEGCSDDYNFAKYCPNLTSIKFTDNFFYLNNSNLPKNLTTLEAHCDFYGDGVQICWNELPSSLTSITLRGDNISDSRHTNLQLSNLKFLSIDQLSVESVAMLFINLDACGTVLDQVCIPRFTSKEPYSFKHLAQINGFRDRMLARGVPADKIVLDPVCDS